MATIAFSLSFISILISAAGIVIASPALAIFGFAILMLCLGIFAIRQLAE